MSFPRPSFLLALWAIRVRGTPFLLICLQNYEKIIKRKPAFPLFFQNESLFLRGRIIMQSFCICMPVVQVVCSMGGGLGDGRCGVGIVVCSGDALKGQLHIAQGNTLGKDARFCPCAL